MQRLTYRPVLSDLDYLRRHLDRALETPAATTPAMELENTHSALILRAELPGVNRDDIDIRLTANTVTLSGKRPQPQGKQWSEFRYGEFRRSLRLPVAVHSDRAKAEFVDGILTLTLPKYVAQRPQVVKVNLGDRAVSEIPEPATTDSDDPWK